LLHHGQHLAPQGPQFVWILQAFEKEITLIGNPPP